MIRKFSSTLLLVALVSTSANAGLIKKAVIGAAVVGAGAALAKNAEHLLTGKLYWKDIESLSVSQEPLFRNIHACYATTEHGFLHYPCTSDGKPTWSLKPSSEYIEYPKTPITKKYLEKNPEYYILKEHIDLLIKKDAGYELIFAKGVAGIFWNLFYRDIARAASSTMTPVASVIEKLFAEANKNGEEILTKQDKQKITTALEKASRSLAQGAVVGAVGDILSAEANKQKDSNGKVISPLANITIQKYYIIKKSKKKPAPQPAKPVVDSNVSKDLNISNDLNISKDSNVSNDLNISTDLNISISLPDANKTQPSDSIPSVVVPSLSNEKSDEQK